jgi:hypothetical protein
MTAEMLELLAFVLLLVLGQPHLHHRLESRNHQGRTTWVVLNDEEEWRSDKSENYVEFIHKARLGKSKPFNFQSLFAASHLKSFNHDPRKSCRNSGQPLLAEDDCQ